MNEEKHTLRQALLQRRERLDAALKAGHDAQICDHLIRSATFLQAGAVLLYASTAREIQTAAIAVAALRAGKQVAYPVTFGGGRMQFFCIDAPDQLAPGRYGIDEPPQHRPLMPELLAQSLCVVPGLTFDAQGHRLGYGGGYYDRFLADYPGTSMGLVYHDLVCAQLPHEPHDQAVRYLCTEQGIFACGPHYSH